METDPICLTLFVRHRFGIAIRRTFASKNLSEREEETKQHDI